LHTGGDEGADAAEADHAEGLLEQLGSGERAALPGTAGERRVRGRNVTREADDVAARELGGRDDVRRRSIDDHDAGLGRGLDVDVVATGSGAGDDLEVRRVRDRLFVHLRGGTDQHRARLGQRLEERGTVGTVDRTDIEIGTEGLDRGGGKLLCEKNDGLRQSGSFETALRWNGSACGACRWSPA